MGSFGIGLDRIGPDQTSLTSRLGHSASLTTSECRRMIMWACNRPTANTSIPEWLASISLDDIQVSLTLVAPVSSLCCCCRRKYDRLVNKRTHKPENPASSLNQRSRFCCKVVIILLLPSLSRSLGPVGFVPSICPLARSLSLSLSLSLSISLAAQFKVLQV